MNCGRCERGDLLICPECGKKIVICSESETSGIKYKYWYEEIGCDGIE